MKNPYEDIIHLPHHRSSKHPHMPRHKRASQFSPFAALTGYEEAVSEAARVTERRVELDDNIKADLNKKLARIQENIDKNPEVSITYFRGDEVKDGGSYVKVRGCVKKIDEYEAFIKMKGGKKILISDIIELGSAE